MTIQNVTKRASKAMYELSIANEKLTPLLYVVKEEGDLKTILEICDSLNKAQQELVKILAQDNKIELSLI